MGKTTEGLIWLGRIAVSIAVTVIIANGLMKNPRFNDPLTSWAGGIVAGVLCLGMLYIIATKGK
jgi:hypothetical protein